MAIGRAKAKLASGNGLHWDHCSLRKAFTFSLHFLFTFTIKFKEIPYLIYQILKQTVRLTVLNGSKCGNGNALM